MVTPPKKKKPKPSTVNATVFLSPVPPTKALLTWSFFIRGWAGLRGCPSEDGAAGGLIAWALSVRLAIITVSQRVGAQVVEHHGQQHPPYHDQKETRATGSLLHRWHLLQTFRVRAGRLRAAQQRDESLHGSLMAEDALAWIESVVHAFRYLSGTCFK